MCPLDVSLAGYGADFAAMLLAFLKYEAGYACILPNSLQYEAASAANLPVSLLREVDRAAIPLHILNMMPILLQFRPFSCYMKPISLVYSLFPIFCLDVEPITLPI